MDKEVEGGAAAGGAAVLGGVGQLRLEAGRAHGAGGQHGVVQGRDEGRQLAGGGGGAGRGGRQVCSEGNTVSASKSSIRRFVITERPWGQCPFSIVS